MSDTAAIQTGGAAGTKPPLDDVMLAMDVVDTLRRRERIANNELDDQGREEDLKERLRKIYADQGLEVPDRVIEQAVAALKEGRFTVNGVHRLSDSSELGLIPGDFAPMSNVTSGVHSHGNSPAAESRPDHVSRIGSPGVISSRVPHHPAYGSVQGGSNQRGAFAP